MESVCGTRCWEALNMAQIEKLDKIAGYIEHSSSDRKQLETK
jgi:hypothetical protein